MQAIADAAWPALKVLRFVRWDPGWGAPPEAPARLRARAPVARLEVTRQLSALAR